MRIARREWLKACGAALLGSGVHLPSLAQAGRGAGARVVVLGQSVPLTGMASEIGLAFAGGSRLGVNDFNERHADSGLQLKLVQLDDGYDAATAARNAQTLLAKDKADLLFGFVGTASSSAGADVAARQGNLLFAPFAAADTLRDASHPHVFHVRPGMIDEALKIVRQCATVGQTRIALVGDDNAMGQAGRTAVEQALTELKMPALVATAMVPPGGDDKLDALLKPVLAQKPQAVVLVSLSGVTAGAIRSLRKSGYSSSFMAFSIVGTDPLYSQLGKDAGGVVITQVVPSPRPSAIPIVKEYRAALDNSDETPSYAGLEGFIAVKTLGEAVRRAGRGFTSASLQKVMSAMTDYDVGGFRINLRPGLRDPSRSIDLISISADGRVLR